MRRFSELEEKIVFLFLNASPSGLPETFARLAEKFFPGSRPKTQFHNSWAERQRVFDAFRAIPGKIKKRWDQQEPVILILKERFGSADEVCAWFRKHKDRMIANSQTERREGRLALAKTNHEDTIVRTQGEAPGNQNCKHHWVIEPPRGPFSRGVCKKCGVVRDDFRNSIFSDEILVG